MYGIRPIAIPDTFRKIVGRLILKVEKRRIIQILGKVQLGVAVENGMDCIIKSVKMLNELQPDLDTVCLDFKNAFKNIGRFQFGGVW